MAAAAPAAAAAGESLLPLGDTVAMEAAAVQVLETAQVAVSSAAAEQVAPANIAVVGGGAWEGAAIVRQANSASAGAAAGSNSTSSQAASGSGAPHSPHSPGGLPAPGLQQAAGTIQAAAAQASVFQVAPINVAVPIIVASPGASAVVIQTNNAAAQALAGNSSSTTQTASPAPGGGTLGRGAAPRSGALAGAIEQIISTAFPQAHHITLNWNWNWNWNWNGSWALRKAVRSSRARELSFRAEADGATPRLDSASAGDPGPFVLGESTLSSKRALSSTFVQEEAFSPSELPLVPPIGRHAAPGGSSAGAGISPLTVVVGALLALALQLLTSAGLGRRVSLATVGWRRQAYLTPLERPG